MKNAIAMLPALFLLPIFKVEIKSERLPELPLDCAKTVVDPFERLDENVRHRINKSVHCVRQSQLNMFQLYIFGPLIKRVKFWKEKEGTYKYCKSNQICQKSEILGFNGSMSSVR